MNTNQSALVSENCAATYHRMSKNLFAKAVEDAAFSVTTSEDGSRDVRERERFVGRRPSRGRYRGRSSYRGRGGYHQVRGDVQPRSYLMDEDDDFDMGGSVQSRSDSRFNPYGTRPPSRRGSRQDYDKSGDIKSRLGPGPSNRSTQLDWHKVVIYQGKKHDKEWLIRKLQSASDEAFQPVDFHYVKGDGAAFFVEGKKIADALKKVSHRITVKDGSKLIVTVRPSDPPRNVTSSVSGDGVRGSGGNNSSLNEDTKQALKDCLSKRYDALQKALNLTDLFHDDVLKANNVQGILSRHWLAAGIVKLIGENCPDLQSLDVSNNRLNNLDGFKELPNHASSLKHLNLSNNQLRGVEELDKIKGLNQLLSLHMEDNPLCEKFQTRESSYISAVRSRFPKVTCLDGHDLPPPIGFDLPEGAALPTSKGSYLGSDPRIKELLQTFLEQYFKVYDSGDRQALLEAYHDQAIFSLCVNTGTMSKDRRGPSLGEYMKNSRNMKRLSEPEKRSSLLKHSRLSVVAFLNELPVTKHELSSFVVDVCLAVPTCLTFAVRGLFLENLKILRSFSRVFVAVPAGGGKALSIINDELHIRNASPAEQEKADSKLDASKSVQTSSTSTALPVITGATQTTTQQQQMVLQFSQQSAMNIEWSYKCLSENQWDYEKAALAFTSSKNNGSIPPEAFIK